MKKNVIAEVSRVREIMGVSLLTEGPHSTTYTLQLMINQGGELKPMMETMIKALNKKLVVGGWGFSIHREKMEGMLYRWIIGPVSDSVYFEGEAKKGNGLLYAEKWKKVLTSLYWPNTFIIKECNGKRIKMDQECDGDAGDEKGDVGGKEFDKVIFSDSLNVNNMPTFDPTKESEIYSCKVEGCSQWVSDTLKKFQGNAWHAHRNGRNKYSTYENAGTNLIPDMVSLFNLVNKNPKEKSQEEKAKKISKSLVPDQGNFSNLEIDDIVGLFYEPSYNHTKAFFEGMTGYKKMGGEKAAADGPFMLNAKNNDVWTPEMLGQNIKFKGGNTLHKGQSPGINTHLGFVGAIVDGEPIIFHNIDKQVWATPLSKMNKNKTAIVWARGGGGGGGTTETTVKKDEKTTKQKNTELLKKGIKLLYKKGKEFFD